MSTDVIEVAGLAVEIVRKPIKNLHVGVYPPMGRVRVAVPPSISEDAVRVAVVTRLGWIKKKQREFADQARETHRRYVSGETHYVFGKPLRLKVTHGRKRGCAIFIQNTNRLVLDVPAVASEKRRQQWMTAWYRTQLKACAGPKITKWANRLGVSEPLWGVRLMKTKWGSCNPDKQRVWLNLDLAKKPLQALDYVILHEMAHFVSRHHDDVFVSVMDRQMPAWRQVRADLNALPLSEW